MILLILFLKLPKNQPLEDFPGSGLANRNRPILVTCRKTRVADMCIVAVPDK